MKSIFTTFLIFIYCQSFSQTATFTYQYENDQAKGGRFVFDCPQDESLSFEADASAGYLVGSNDPYYQSTKDVGPIPNGTWTITGVKKDHPELSILILQATDDVSIPDRNGFLIHGVHENGTPENSSHGCIILERKYRKKLAEALKYGIITLKVTNFTTSDPSNNG